MKNQRNAAIQWLAVLVLAGATMTAFVRTTPGPTPDATVAARVA